MMMMVVMMRGTSSCARIRHTIVLPGARQQPVRWRCIWVRSGCPVMPRMRSRRSLTRLLLLRMMMWRRGRLLLLRWWRLLMWRWWRTVLRRVVTAAATRSATVRSNRLGRLTGWRAGRRWRSHAARVGRRKPHRWAHVVRWTHRWMHARPVAVTLAGWCRTGGATVRALVLQVLLQVVQWLW